MSMILTLVLFSFITKFALNRSQNAHAPVAADAETLPDSMEDRPRQLQAPEEGSLLGYVRMAVVDGKTLKHWVSSVHSIMFYIN